MMMTMMTMMTMIMTMIMMMMIMTMMTMIMTMMTMMMTIMDYGFGYDVDQVMMIILNALKSFSYLWIGKFQQRPKKS